MVARSSTWFSRVRDRAARIYNAATDRGPYDGAAQTRRASTWRAPTTNPNQFIDSSLTLLRDRSRRAVRNDGWATAISGKLVANIIGTGIVPLPQVDDPELKARIKALWTSWTDESDADGKLDFYGQQTQACRAWFEGGEVFVRFRHRRIEDGLTVPLQIQLLEPELCPHTYNAQLPSGNRVRAGIEFDQIGRIVAYHFYAQRPGFIDEVDTTTLRRVPASMVSHIMDPLRPGQIRGLPLLSPVLVRLWEMEKTDDATLLRVQIATLFAGFIKSEESADDADINPLTGQANTLDADTDAPMVTLEAGTMQVLQNGQSVDFSKPPDPPQGYAEFMRHQLRAACAGVGIPYELVTGDLGSLNDRTMRVLLGEFRRRIEAWQHQLFAHQLCRRVYAEWMDRAFLSGALDLPASYAIDPRPLRAVKWQPNGWAYINPLQDVQAANARVRGGFSSRELEVSEMGLDVEVIDEQNAADNKRADAYALRYDSDGRTDQKGQTFADQPADPAATGAAA